MHKSPMPARVDDARLFEDGELLGVFASASSPFLMTSSRKAGNSLNFAAEATAYSLIMRATVRL